MKIFAFLFVAFFAAKSCDGQFKNDLKNATIHYTARSRGFYQRIKVENQTVSTSIDPTATENIGSNHKLSEEELKEFIDLFQAINLDSISTIEPPTQKRLYDGAAMANLEVIYNEKVYRTKTFDHGYPPKQIKKLVEKLNTFAKKQQ